VGNFKIKKGLDLPIAGAPQQSIENRASVHRVALTATDYIGMKPTFFVQEGDTVKRGQPLFEDKKSPGTIYTSPGAGVVTGILRGEKRALQSVVIELSESERSGDIAPEEEVAFEHFSGKSIPGLSTDEIRALLIESGLWTAFRTRPFSKVPSIDSEPDGIFITAMDTNPLAPSPEQIVQGQEDAFEQGLAAIAKLREGHIYLSVAENSPITAGPYSGVTVNTFSGPHPSGTAGLHIHTLYPAHRERTVWHIGYQDVIAIGQLFLTGELNVDRVISLAGPSVINPRLIRTRIGASTDELCEGEINDGDTRCISGSILSGRAAQGDVLGYLGRYHNQVTCLPEGREREFLGWLTPGANKFSTVNIFSSCATPKKRFNFTTTTNGSERSMVPIGMYERVMPLDILPTFLLRALLAGDIEGAEKLGCLELDEEDLALCTFVCPGKYEYGPYLRQALTQIEREG